MTAGPLAICLTNLDGVIKSATNIMLLEIAASHFLSQMNIDKVIES